MHFIYFFPRYLNVNEYKTKFPSQEIFFTELRSKITPKCGYILFLFSSSFFSFYRNVQFMYQTSDRFQWCDTPKVEFPGRDSSRTLGASIIFTLTASETGEASRTLTYVIKHNNPQPSESYYSITITKTEVINIEK